MEYLVVLVLLSFSALFSGLTLGFFSLNRDDLERKAELGDIRAQKIFKLRQRGNLLLSTLLIGNVAVNSTLSIFLGSIISGVLAGIISTFLIVVLGEILPQAMFARHALAWGAKMVWLVKIIRFIFYPVCFPIAFLLDRFLGDEVSTVYSKTELVKLIEDHEDHESKILDADEERIIKGALSYSDKTVGDIMTPRTAMFTLSYKTVLDKHVVEEIRQKGHSRIPVYQKNRDEIIGILYVKDLLGQDWPDQEVSEFMREKVIFVDKEKKLDELLNKFKKSRNHLFIVSNKYGSVSGLVTIEDVIEEIIGEEIMDEYDRHADMQKLAEEKLQQRLKHKE